MNANKRDSFLTITASYRLLGEACAAAQCGLELFALEKPTFRDDAAEAVMLVKSMAAEPDPPEKGAGFGVRVWHWFLFIECIRLAAEAGDEIATSGDVAYFASFVRARVFRAMAKDLGLVDESTAEEERT